MACMCRRVKASYVPLLFSTLMAAVSRCTSASGIARMFLRVPVISVSPSRRRPTPAPRPRSPLGTAISPCVTAPAPWPASDLSDHPNRLPVRVSEQGNVPISRWRGGPYRRACGCGSGWAVEGFPAPRCNHSCSVSEQIVRRWRHRVGLDEQADGRWNMLGENAARRPDGTILDRARLRYGWGYEKSDFEF